jgi:DNA/RNA endonuclease G (NUC1)
MPIRKSFSAAIRRTFLVSFATFFLIATVVSLRSTSALTNNGNITTFGSPLTENFDTLAATPTATPLAWTDNSTIPGWYTNQATYRAIDGNSNTGSVYSFGSAGSTDRALGSVGSSGTNDVYWAVKFVNNTGGTITSLSVSYVGEEWRAGGCTPTPCTPAAQTVDFQYQVANTGVITDANIPSTNWLDHDPLDFTSPVTGTQTGVPLDGNAAANRTALASTITFATPVNNGQEIWLRWKDINHANNDHGLAIDDLSVTANGVGGGTPAPTPIPTATPTPAPPVSTNPTGIGSANPNSVLAGASSLLTVNVTPGTNPPSSGLTVVANLSSIGGSVTQQFLGSGNSFTFQAVVDPGTTPGSKTLPVTITDAEARTGSASITLTVEQPPPPADHVVISQVYGGGGNSGATFTNDFVELYNPSTVTFDLNGWTVQYSSAGGSSWDTGKQPLGGTIAPGEYYLVSLASSGAVGEPLPPANATGEVNMSGTTGKVALVNNGVSLIGTCPVGGASIVDFVGYGTTANCREGATNAPAPSNTTAVLRKNSGALDTNNNANDFATGTPTPRRTAPFAEVGPAVISTDPISGGTNAPRDDSVTVNFTEPVDVVGSWFNVNCAHTGPHNDATVSGGGKSFVITPNVSFEPGEQCTVTVNKDAVHDEDTDDSAPNTDTLAADFSWSFTVAVALAPPPYPRSVHLTMGNPTGATADINHPDNYLMEKDAYTLSYNRDKGTPNWVSWHLDSSWTGNLTRVDSFRPDPQVPADWYRVQATDFFSTGFDRGHMTPNADRDNANSIPINQETFLMSNMVPQAPGNNQGPWADLENFLRSLLNNNEVYIVSGPAGVGGTGSSGGVTTTVAGGHVTVPAQTWKVALVLPKGDDDVSRVTAATRTIAVIMPNDDAIRADDWTRFIVSVDQVEQLTGYDFFSNVPDAIENSIEAGVNGTNPPGTTTQSVTTAEDTPATITLSAVSPDTNPIFTYTVSQPAHGTLTGTGADRVYNPAPDFSGTDSFTFSVSDGHANSNTSTVTITVTEVNDAPLAADDSKSTQEDTPLSFPAGDLTVNDSVGAADESGQTLTVSSVSGGADTHGTVALEGGQVTYTPELDYHGAASFTYQVCDDGTTAGSSDPRCATAVVNVTVASVNDAPTVASQSAETDEDTAKLITLGGSDVDGDSLSFSIVNPPAHGSATLSGATVTYTPSANYNGTDSFTFKANDGTVDSAPATVSLVINPVNDAPTLGGVPASASINELTSYTFTASAIDVDVPAQALTFSLVNAPIGATINPSTGVFTWTPSEAQGGTGVPFGFKVRVTDGVVATDNDVTLTVNEINQAPLLNPIGDRVVILGDTLAFTAIGSDTDIPFQTLSYGLSGVVPAGATINSATGAFSWTPTAAQSGFSYTFNVVVSDGIMPTLTTITVSVVGPFGIEQGVLSQLIALRQSTTDKQDGQKLDDAIQHLSRAVDPGNWIDAAHVQPKQGEKAFGETKDAVNKLRDLLKNKKSAMSDALLQSFIDRLLRATRLVAQTAINESAAAGGDPNDIAKANDELAQGDADASGDKPDSAVEHYRNAWQNASKK